MSDETSNSPANYVLLTRLADEFAARYRAGERPNLQEYIDRHPALAEDIRELFPAMVEIEQVKEDHEQAAEQAEAPADPALRQLGDFRILREVGKGGMGIVYEAEQVSLGRHVALKVLPKIMLLDAQAKRRFEREAKSAAKLHHTNIVPVFGVGEQDGLPYYVMQYIQGLGLDAVLDGLNHIKPGGSTAGTDGEVSFSRKGATAAQMARSLMTGAFPHAEDSLDQARVALAVTLGFDAPREEEETGRPSGENAASITSPPPAGTPHSGQHSDSFNLSASSLSFPGTSSPVTGRKSTARKETYWHRVASIGHQVADALDYAHKQGILHRDIKPSNLLLDMRGTVWVTDFGLAEAAGPGADDLTKTGDILGTLRYMPPESFEGKSDARSDVYALGLTLYELLAMRPAFAEKDRNKLIKIVTAEEPMRLDTMNPEIPRDLVTIVQKTIEKEPLRRYATAADLAADLHRYIDDEPILARRQTELEKYVRWARHHPGIAWLSAVLTAVLVGGLIAAIVVAGRMARIAEDERSARQQAEGSEKREAQEREHAEQAKTTAEISFTKAREAERLARAAEEEGRKLLYTTNMQLAPFLWKDDRTTAAQVGVLLAKHIPDRNAALAKPDLRGFEWYYYQHLLETSAPVFSVPGATMLDGAFNSNGQLLTLSSNSQVRRWDLGFQQEDLAHRRDLLGDRSTSVCVFSTDGQLAALADGDKVRVFDTSTGKEALSIDSANEPFRLLAFSRDSHWLAIVDDKIRWCKSATGEVIASVDRKFNEPHYLDLSADGLTLAVAAYGDNHGRASIYRLDATAKAVTLRAEIVTGTIHASALSPDGQRLAVGPWGGGTLLVFDTATGGMIARRGAATASRISAIAFSDDGANLASADDQGTIKIWADARNLTSKSTVLLTLKGHQAQVNRLRFSNDGKRLFTASWRTRSWQTGGQDRTASVWDLENAGTAMTPLQRAGRSVVAGMSSDGQLIAGASARGICLWDAATGRLVRNLPAGEQGRVTSVAFSPADSRLLAVGYGGQANVSYVTLLDIDAGMELARLPGAIDLPGFQADEHSGAIGSLAFSPNGEYLVAAFGDIHYWPQTNPNSSYPLKVWEAATRRLIRTLNGHTHYCVSLGFSRDGKLLASGSYDSKAMIWSTKTWIATQTLQAPNPVYSTAFSPDGKTLALGCMEGNMQWWDVATGHLLEGVNAHATSVRAIVFSPDGLTMASGSEDQTVRLWNVPTRRQLMQLDHGSLELGTVQTLHFSPDGKHLFAGGLGSIAIWTTAPIGWNDPERSAEKLRLLLNSNADFKSRVRMFSENLRLHEALGKLDTEDVRVKAALAAAQANWHASRGEWAAAVAAFDRLVAVDPTDHEDWLRTPGLLRVATALVQQDRPAQAAILLQGGAKRRAEDGLPAVVKDGTLGFLSSAADGGVQVSELLPGSPAARSPLVPGDVVVKVNDVELKEVSPSRLSELLAGQAGTKVKLSVRHSGSEKLEVIELTRARFINDPAAGDQLYPLRSAVDERLAKEPEDAGLLELRAELAGQWSDAKAQAADYTAAIEALAQKKPENVAADLKRLYYRRGSAYVALRHWQPAIDDFARVVTAATTDDTLLSNQALALAETMLTKALSSDLAAVDQKRKHLAMTKFTDPWQKLAAAYQLKGDQKAIDQLVERRPKSAGPIGDLFTQGKDQDKDWRRAIDLYSKGITAKATDALLLAKRARAYEALKNWEAAAGDWARAATLNPDGAKLLAEFARRLVADGQVSLANGQFEKSRALYERSLEMAPENDLVAMELAQLLLDQQENENATRWTVLKPVEAKSQLGATLSLLPDDSILASGADPMRDRYRVVLTARAPINVVAVRLEALTHHSLPGNGPGRTPNGSFAQASWNVSARSPDRRDPITLQFENAWADHQLAGWPITSTGHWNIAAGGEGRNCTAIWSMAKPDFLGAGTALTFEMQFKSWNNMGENLGHFRLSMTSDHAALERNRTLSAAMKLIDPWAKLAAVYHVIGDQPALDKLLKQHPTVAATIGDLYATAQDWERAIVEYRKLGTAEPADGSLSARLAAAYQSAGRTREAVPHLAKASAANPKDTVLALTVAALQAWFAQEKELAATRDRILAFAKSTNGETTAERAAKACSILPSPDKAELEAALALGRAAVIVETGSELRGWRLLALGMAEYRSGNDAAADEALRAAGEAGPNNRWVPGISAFYRAMSLFRQRKKDEARTLATAAAAKMTPLPKDERNPLSGGANHDDLILWLAYKEAMAMIRDN